MVLAGNTKPIVVHAPGESTSPMHAEVGDYFELYLDHDGSASLPCEGRWWMEVLE
jgi:hypothetical protein